EHALGGNRLGAGDRSARARHRKGGGLSLAEWRRLHHRHVRQVRERGRQGGRDHLGANRGEATRAAAKRELPDVQVKAREDPSYRSHPSYKSYGTYGTDRTNRTHRITASTRRARRPRCAAAGALSAASAASPDRRRPAPAAPPRT